MRKLMLAFMTVLVVGLTSCKKEEKNEIVASWKWTSVYSKSDPGSKETPGSDFYLALTNDGKFYQIAFAQGETDLSTRRMFSPIQGTYIIDGNKIIFSSSVLGGGLLEGNFRFLNSNKIKIDITKGESDYVNEVKKVSLDIKNLYDNRPV